LSKGAQISWVVLTVGLDFELLSEAVVFVLQALKTKISNLPNVKKFLQPGSQRKPPITEQCMKEIRKIFK
jgi:hypothetical protein